MGFFQAFLGGRSERPRIAATDQAKEWQAALEIASDYGDLLQSADSPTLGASTGGSRTFLAETVVLRAAAPQKLTYGEVAGR